LAFEDIAHLAKKHFSPTAIVIKFGLQEDMARQRGTPCLDIYDMPMLKYGEISPSPPKILHSIDGGSTIQSPRFSVFIVYFCIWNCLLKNIF